jgi:hypothetical protein
MLEFQIIILYFDVPVIRRRRRRRRNIAISHFYLIRIVSVEEEGRALVYMTVIIYQISWHQNTVQVNHHENIATHISLTPLHPAHL